jgi:hypothetical protein
MPTGLPEMLVVLVIAPLSKPTTTVEHEAQAREPAFRPARALARWG